MAGAISSRIRTSGGHSGKSSGKAWLGVAGFAAAVLLFNIHALGSGSSLMSAEAPAASTTFLSECMSAETLARPSVTPEDSADLRKMCDAAFNRHKPTEAMLAVREGRPVVRHD